MKLVMGNRENGVPRPADTDPAQTACTGYSGGLHVVHLRGTVELQRHGDVRPAHEPVHTVRAGGRHHGLLVMRNNHHRGDPGYMVTPKHEPVRTLTTGGHQSIVIPYARGNEPMIASVEPVSTLTSRDRLSLLVPAGGTWADETTLADLEPAPTQLARDARAVVEVTDADIDACGFRMFDLSEIAGAMAFRPDYTVIGNKRERMAQYGNAVTPPVMALLVSRLLERIQAETFTDLFCGAGGSSDGARSVGGELVLGLNHWQRAIDTHSANFPDAEHDCEDVSSLTTAQIRRYPDSDILMASPECTNHSLAKGARRTKPQEASLFDDGPAGDAEQDRSRATMWDVVRFAEQKQLKGRPYKAIVVENVVDARKWGANDNGALFDAWLMALDGLGYEHEIVWLNSMFAGVPQSRDRMYVVFWLKGILAPDLRMCPPSWCAHCSKVVAGRQIWKRPDSYLSGRNRYGTQYVYGCPECHGIVHPGAPPAIGIIDESIEAPIIGEREKPLALKTRARIKRGIERIASEPFAIRLLHGGAPSPLTLPLVTLTQRQDMAMVMPVAGNTFERTPGNRAIDGSVTPLATVHKTLDRALVVPPMGDVEARDAEVLPMPTQTTTTRAGLVERRAA